MFSKTNSRARERTYERGHYDDPRNLRVYGRTINTPFDGRPEDENDVTVSAGEHGEIRTKRPCLHTVSNGGPTTAHLNAIIVIVFDDPPCGAGGSCMVYVCVCEMGVEGWGGCRRQTLVAQTTWSRAVAVPPAHPPGTALLPVGRDHVGHHSRSESLLCRRRPRKSPTTTVRRAEIDFFVTRRLFFSNYFWFI